MSMHRVLELADHFEALAQRIPGDTGPSQPWQDEVVEAVEECLESRTDALTDLVRSLVPVARVAAFKAALRKLRDRAGRYSPSNKLEIEQAMVEVNGTFGLMRASIEDDQGEPARRRTGSLSADVSTLTGTLYEWDQEHADTSGTFNTRALAEALGWEP